jgi:lipid A 3-O-deacylase
MFTKLFDRAPVRLAVAAIVALLLVFAPQARAEEPHFLYDFKLGILGHDQSYWLSHHRREDHMGVDLNLDVTFKPAYAVPYFGGFIRPAIGGTLSAIGTNIGYIDARYRIDSPFSLYLPREVFFSVGLGGAIHNGNRKFEADDRKAFGSRVLFHVPVEIGWQFNYHHSIALYLEHVSNARLASPNEGMDNVGVRYGYRF